MENKNIFASNLQRYMNLNKVTRTDLSAALGVSYYTITSWVNGSKYPRMDKVEMLADYFGILKSDLIEDKMTEEKEKDNETLAGIIVRMRTDEDFCSLVESLYMYDSAKIKSIAEMLKAFSK